VGIVEDLDMMKVIAIASAIVKKGAWNIRDLRLVVPSKLLSAGCFGIGICIVLRMFIVLGAGLRFFL
jgi:hypothetical protein